MIIENIDTSDLPEHDPYSAFVVFVGRLHAKLDEITRVDRNIHSDRDGFYTGTFAPERYYAGSILAFADEYELLLDEDLPDITEAPNETFVQEFDRFCGKINYIVTRLTLRGKKGSTSLGTPISISESVKSRINDLLNTIQKIVNQEIDDQNKRDAIFRKIAALQSEINRDRTTADALFTRMIEFSRAVGESAGHIEPLIEKVERLMKAIWDGVKILERLPRKERPKALPKAQDAQPALDLDDEIPF